MGIRLALGGAACAVAGWAMAQPQDLVSHNGFEPCWSSAITLDAFLQQLAGATRGREVCLPTAKDGSSCAGSLCSDGSPGCSVTLREGLYVPGPIQVADPGTARFDGFFGFEPFSMPVVVPTVGPCLVNFVDTTEVRIDHSIGYQLRPDGNSGYLLFDGLAFNTSVTGMTTNNVSVTGSFACQFVDQGISFYIGTLEAQLADAFQQVIVDETEGRLLCPLP